MKGTRSRIVCGVCFALVVAFALLRPFTALTAGPLGAANPVPLINQPLVPDAVAPGGPGFTLTVNGTGFVSGSVVNWSGSPRATTFVSSSQLTASILASDIAAAGEAFVTVGNPTPGGGVSSPVDFEVASPVSALLFSGTQYLVGRQPLAVATADLNGDGRLDLIVTNGVDETVSVLLGRGDGTFQTQMTYPTTSVATSVTAADFNGDGKPDFAVNNTDSGTVSIFLGNGDGSFAQRIDYATGSFPESVVAADFNGDGKLDLAVPNGGDNTISILIGNGDGTFQSQVTFSAGFVPVWVAAGDFNGDGKLDLAVTNFSEDDVSVFLGNGDGTFEPRVNYTFNFQPGGIATADLNGDGKLDLAVTDSQSEVAILLGNGDGSFQSSVEYPTVPGSAFLVGTGDFNGDGKLDLLTSGEQSVSILLGNSDGSFQAPLNMGQGYFSAISADFNRDGRLDLVTTNEGSNTITVLLQTVTPGLVLSPTSLTFPARLVGTVGGLQNSTLTNTGNATLSILSIAASGDFVQQNTCGASVAVGKSCIISVLFRATT